MDESDLSERERKLKREIAAKLEDRADVSGFEFRSTDDPGIHVVVEEADEVRRYHVTLEHLPDGSEKTHWSYLGENRED